MIRTSLILALCLAVGSPSAVAAQQQARPSAQPAQEDTAIDLSTEPTRLFPAALNAYVEIPHVGSVIDGLGARETLLDKINSVIAPKPAVPPASGAPAADNPAALTSREMSTLLDASASICMLPGKGDSGPESLGIGSIAAVVRLGSPEAAALLRDKVIARLAAAADAKSTVEKMHGLDVTVTGSVCYVVSGKYVLAGSPDAVRTVLDTAATRRAPRFGDDPGYNSAISKHTGGQDQVLAFFPGRAVAEFLAMMFGLQAPVESESSKNRRPDPARDAMRSFSGLDAVKGVAIGARIENGVLHARYDLEIDRSIRGLLSTLADPPAISFRCVSVLPASTEQLQVFSLDLTRIYDLLDQSFGSLPPSSPGGSTFAGEVSEIEQYIGVSLRSDLLPALGTEVAYTGSLDSVFGSRGTRKGEKRPISVFLVEVRNPEIVRKAVANALTESPGVPAPARDYKGVDTWTWSGLTVALVDGFAIAGNTADVQMCIDAQQSDTTLARRPEFSTVAASWHGDTLYATYRSPEDEAAPNGAPVSIDDGGEPLGPSMFLRVGLSSVSTPTTIFRDGTGVHWENGVPVDPMVAGMNEAIGALFAPAKKPGPAEENDSAVIDVLQSAALAEAMFHSKANRYGTLEELTTDPDLPSGVDVAHIVEKASKVGYRFTVTPFGTGDGARFEITATPIEYAKPARMSYFIDQSFVVRAADKQGAPASSEDAAMIGSSEDDVDEPNIVEPAPDTDPAPEEAPE
ncbi:MAG TPA: hypothetical protein PLF26_11680 [Blastocatellia bacterium]|nr:hypothetical protein [Blastocatellia bacterium]